MIYCNVKGGLCNVMFQIAAAKAIALKYNTDCSFPNLFNQLDLINNDNTYNPSLKHAYEYMCMFNGLRTDNPIETLSVFRYPFHYTEMSFTDGDVVIDGFFQSEKYFADYRGEILDLFEMPSSVREYLEMKYLFFFGKRIDKITSIHVRRGDYLNHPKHHPTQTLEYYSNAMSMLHEDTDYFMVFSDDIEWCKENIVGDKPIIYIDNEKDYIELYMMSLCDNHIVANSSFSWWGAWLNRNVNKKVIAPSKWFGKAIQHNTSDIIPKSWIKI